MTTVEIFMKSNYNRFKRIVKEPEKLPGYVRLESSGFMPLGIEKLFNEGKKVIMALSHYYKHPSGDMIPDPDMEVRIDHEAGTMEALTFQDFFGYRRVYDQNGNPDPRTQKELNAFLGDWLRNLEYQGFSYDPETGEGGKTLEEVRRSE